MPGVKEPVRYRWAIYTKREGGVNRYEEAYFTFLHDGDWVPDAADRWKMFRYHPGLFKVQISHAVSSLSENGEGPCESLLKARPEINDRCPGDRRPGWCRPRRTGSSEGPADDGLPTADRERRARADSRSRRHPA